MSVEVTLHPKSGDSSASVKGADNVHWLTINSSGSKIVIFGNAKNVDALKMISDVFNDAFAPPEPDPAPAVTIDFNDDVHF